MRAYRSSFGHLLVLGLCALPGNAFAKPAIAVLAFGGEGGDASRKQIVDALSSRYQVIHGQKLLDACDKLGISMTRGANLARAAAAVGVVAVVGGTVKGGGLVVAVYSGKTGQPLQAGVAPGANKKKALVLILKGLRKAPKSVGKRPAPEPDPMPEPVGTKGGAKDGGSGTKGGGSGSSSGGLEFDPSGLVGGGGGGSGGGSGGVATAADGSDPEENPLSKTKGMDFSGGGGGGPPPVVTKKPDPFSPRLPRLEATVGLGTWIRAFSINDPREKPPEYEGAAFTLRFALLARPAGFFTDNFASNIFLRFGFKQAVGLQSKSKQPDGTTGALVEKILGTALREFLIDAGYNWKLMRKPRSPYLDLGMGYGMMDFGIDWEASSTPNMPGAAYRFLLFNLGFRLPIMSWLGAYAGADYRVVFGSGEIEDEQKWYGPSSTGGVNLAIGASGNFKKFIGTVEYAYTRYFFAFKNEGQRETNPTNVTRLAGGALDLFHTLMVNVGYSY